MADSCITLLTDFGLRDTYVGQMKGVLAQINPAAKVIDLTHDIEPQQIAMGARALTDAVPAFAPGTIHLAVVDPGVGSNRRLVAVELGDQRFVCPDNGLLTLVAKRLPFRRAVSLVRPQWWRTPISQTFHGRDILAPVAAAWSLGHELTEFGSLIDSPLIELNMAEVVRGSGFTGGRVIAIDRFGNLITNIQLDDLPNQAAHLEIEICGQRLAGISTCYSDRSPGMSLALFGSSGRLEIAVRNGNAAVQFGAAIGQQIIVSWRQQSLDEETQS